MATIQIKRNNSNAATKPSSLLVGELAGNLLDRSLFSSDGSNVFQFYTGTTKWFDTSGNANNANKLGGIAASKYLTGITSAMVTTALGYTPYNSANFTKATIKSTLGIADWALAASKPSYSWSEISGKPTFATIATSGKYSDLSGVPTSLPASDVYAWAKAATKPTYTASEVGALSKNGGTISGTGITPLSINTTATREIGVILKMSNSDKAWLGYTPNVGVHLYSYGEGNGAHKLGLSDAGVGFLDSNTLIHSGNYFSYALPLSGGTRTITSTANTSLILKTNGWHSLIQLDNNHGNSVLFGYYSGSGAVMQNGSNYLAIKDDGTPNYNGNTLIHSGNYSSYALPLSGGTLTGNLSAPLYLLGNGGGTYLDSGASGELVFYDLSARRTVLHAGNYSSYALPLSGGRLTGTLRLQRDTEQNYIVFEGPNNTARGYLGFAGDNNPIYIPKEANVIYPLLHSGNIGSYNAGSATKLQTARTIWGQSFDGTANVSGILRLYDSNGYHANILGNTTGITLDTWRDDVGYFPIKLAPNGGNVLIGTATDNGARLHINASAATTLQAVTTTTGLGIARFLAPNAKTGVTGGMVLDIGVVSSTYNSGNIAFRHHSSGNAANFVSIGLYGNDNILNVFGSGNVAIGTTDSNPEYKLDVHGDGRFSGVVKAYGDGVFGSDARYKSKLQDLAVDIETIANAPVFSYKWTDREDDKVHLGTTAQYWLDTNFRDAVDTSNKDFYHLNYGALGVAIGVSLAKKTVDHEERIKALEKENKELKNELKQLKQWHN